MSELLTNKITAATGTTITLGDSGDTFVIPTGATLTIDGAAVVTSGQDSVVSKINLQDYGEVTNAIGSTGGGTQDIDLTLGNSVSATVDTSTNTFTFSNPTASGSLCAFSLMLTAGVSQTVVWPTTVDWAAATAPVLTAGVDCLVFWTIDGGTIWNGSTVALNLS